MTNHGDDCYFFYYSTCTKGDSCPFRHCEAAMGNETVCNLWQEGRCFRTICKFRHMEITKNRKEIPCYWEKQPAGCQKPHCAFLHEKARYIDGVFVPPDKSISKNEEQPLEEPTPLPVAPLPTAANPQLRGVIKTETQEPVPSPTHPPVVINPTDDDEDEDDQFSEEGEDGKFGLSPRKISKSGDSLNFGVSTLEEIRLRKALKASMKRAGYPIHSADTPANGEKENIQSLFRPDLCEARDGPQEPGRPRGSVAERLGRKMPTVDLKSGSVVLKRSLAERLGRVMEDEESPPQKALKPIKERLGLPAALVAPTHPAENNMESKRAPEQIRIKTLEEIRQERAAKSQSQSDGPSNKGTEGTKTIITKATGGVKQAIALRDDSTGHVKTFSEILQAKKKRQEERKPSPKKAKDAAEEELGQSQAETNTVGLGSSPRATNVEEVRVKTLEEIRREKAARMQGQQAQDPETKKSPDNQENGAKKPRLLRINKLTAQSNVTMEKSPEATVKNKTQPAAPGSGPVISNQVKVKTFEEIMHEKRLRKQEIEEQDRTSAEAAIPQKQAADGTLKRKASAKDSLPLPGSSSPTSTTVMPDSTPSTQKRPLRKLIPFKSKAASPLSSTAPAGAVTVAAVTAVTSVPVRRGSASQGGHTKAHAQSPSSSREASDKTTRSSALLLSKPPRVAPQGPAAETPGADKTLNNQKSPEHTTDTKVRPKLNVKPSVMKPAVQVKPGQKRRGAERSAVAAVKPLNSSPTELDEPPQEKLCRDGQVFPSSSAEAQLSSAVPHGPSSLLDSGTSSSPLREELQTVPVFKQSLSQEPSVPATSTTPREACAVPQSPVLRSPTQPKTRRQSASTSSAAASASAVDEFEKLMNEFTNNHGEEDVDPGIGEDDLLQELSEMIDS